MKYCQLYVENYFLNFKNSPTSGGGAAAPDPQQVATVSLLCTAPPPKFFPGHAYVIDDIKFVKQINMF